MPTRPTLSHRRPIARPRNGKRAKAAVAVAREGMDGAGADRGKASRIQPANRTRPCRRVLNPVAAMWLRRNRYRWQPRVPT